MPIPRGGRRRHPTVAAWQKPRSAAVEDQQLGVGRVTEALGNGRHGPDRSASVGQAARPGASPGRHVGAARPGPRSAGGSRARARATPRRPIGRVCSSSRHSVVVPGAAAGRRGSRTGGARAGWHGLAAAGVLRSWVQHAGRVYYWGHGRRPTDGSRSTGRPATGSPSPSTGSRWPITAGGTRNCSDSGYTDVWSAETDGADGFTPLALAAAWTPALQLGVAIIPAYTRGPGVAGPERGGHGRGRPRAGSPWGSGPPPTSS